MDLQSCIKKHAFYSQHSRGQKSSWKKKIQNNQNTLPLFFVELKCNRNNKEI